MELMTTELRALRRALHAEQLVPPLVRWATRRQHEATALDIRTMRDWAERIADSRELASLVRRLPSTSRESWSNVEDRFPTRLQHHHALLFHRLAMRLESRREFADAHRLGNWSRSAWAHVLADPDYVDDLLSRVSPGEAFSAEEVFLHEFERRVTDLIESLEGALETKTLSATSIDRDLAFYASQALTSWAESDFPLIEPVHSARSALRRIARKPLDAFDRWLDEVNLAEASREQITGPFIWLRTTYQTLGYNAQIASEIVSRTVEFIWTLRRLERDVEATLNSLLEETAPFNETLATSLADAELFGHNARCADFLVFQGERISDRDRRIEIFRRGLELCPGHRNSAKLLSHEYLWDVESALMKIESIASVAAHIGPIRARAERLLDEAEDALDRVEETFAFNESIPDKREEIERHRFRLDIPRSRDA